MGARRKLTRLVREPQAVLMSRVAPHHLFARYGRLARRAGIDGLHLVLSFDCDTIADAEYAWAVHERLRSLGVLASYAVPGELLERGAEAYRRIASSGAEFLNHGYREHTVIRDGRYVSTVFYDRLSHDDLRRDIVEGDRAVRDVIGVRPRGFRVPHFGTFQRPEQLRFLHHVLAELGYEYSSSTVPIWAFRRGPAFGDFGLLEFPVSGGGMAPLRILDSWSYFAAPERAGDADDYEREGMVAAQQYERAGAGILSFYADPSQVHDQPAFFAVAARWAEVAASTSYGELAARLLPVAASFSTSAM